MTNGKKTITRRDFIKTSLALGAGIAPLSPLLKRFGMAEAATLGNDYKAIVCILLEGGADTFNMVVPRAGLPYTAYKNIRQEMALNNTALLPVTPAAYNDGVEYGFHPRMTRLQELFAGNRLAVIGNVGTLIQPVTRTQVENGAPVPSQLFAHNTQRDLWMTANAAQSEKSGWAARLADLFDPTQELFNITVGGKNLMQRGGTYPAFEFNGDEIYAFDDYWSFRKDGALGEAYQRLLAGDLNSSNSLIKAFAGTRSRSMAMSNRLSEVFDNIASFDNFPEGVHETGISLGKQLQAVSRMLAARDTLPGSPKRQIFFVNYHDWDTHSSALDAESHKVDYLDKCLGAFADVVGQLGLDNQVTTCTISDFGRSITPNGAGTDHGWGSHAFVMGGAVRAGDIYGTIPKIEANSPDAVEDRVVPTTSVEQYLATLATWFGASSADLDILFSNLSSFPTRNMGFLV